MWGKIVSLIAHAETTGKLPVAHFPLGRNL
jgi:hypothetical protein